MVNLFAVDKRLSVLILHASVGLRLLILGGLDYNTSTNCS